MNVSDRAFLELFELASEEKRDLILSGSGLFSFEDYIGFSLRRGGRILIVLPSGFITPPANSGTVLSPGFLSLGAVPSAGVYYTDVRTVTEDNFLRFIKEYPFSAVFIPFAECASASQYGYRQSYSFFSDIRASLDYFLPFIIMPSALTEEDCAALLRIFGVRDYISADLHMHAADIVFIRKSSVAAKYAYASSLVADRRARMTVYFSTRRELAEFADVLSVLKIPFSAVHGAVSSQQTDSAARKFRAGEKAVLLATKSLTGSLIFLPACDIIYCGLPFSQAHCRRLTLNSYPGSEAVCVFTGEDEALNMRLIKNQSDFLSSCDGSSVYNQKLALFNRLKNSIFSVEQ